MQYLRPFEALKAPQFPRKAGAAVRTDWILLSVPLPLRQPGKPPVCILKQPGQLLLLLLAMLLLGLIAGHFLLNRGYLLLGRTHFLLGFVRFAALFSRSSSLEMSAVNCSRSGASEFACSCCASAAASSSAACFSSATAAASLLRIPVRLLESLLRASSAGAASAASSYRLSCSRFRRIPHACCRAAPFSLLPLPRLTALYSPTPPRISSRCSAAAFRWWN